ncbi:MAG: ParA family partition ATPase [Acetobacteraceae bacterium]
MPIVIVVAQQKGGAGKTTLAANLAAAFARERKVALLDADPQRTLSHWHSLRAANRDAKASIAFLQITAWRLGIELDRITRMHDLVVIDTPPEIATDARQAVRAADLVLIPLQPSPPDLWAAEGTLRLAAGEHRPARLVLNRAPAASRLRTAIEAEIAARELPALTAVLGNRTAFAAAFARGLSVLESAPRSQAAAELTALAQEIAALAE